MQVEESTWHCGIEVLDASKFLIKFLRHVLLLFSFNTPSLGDGAIRSIWKKSHPWFKYDRYECFHGCKSTKGLRKRRICGIAQVNLSPTSLGSSLSPFVRCGSPGKEGLSRTPPCSCSIFKAIYIPPLRGSILRERNFVGNTVETELV